MDDELYSLSIRINRTLADQLKVLAKNDNRSLSNFITTILKEYTKENYIELEPTTLEIKEEANLEENETNFVKKPAKSKLPKLKK